MTQYEFREIGSEIEGDERMKQKYKTYIEKISVTLCGICCVFHKHTIWTVLIYPATFTAMLTLNDYCKLTNVLVSAKKAHLGSEL